MCGGWRRFEGERCFSSTATNTARESPLLVDTDLYQQVTEGLAQHRDGSSPDLVVVSSFVLALTQHSLSSSRSSLSPMHQHP